MILPHQNRPIFFFLLQTHLPEPDQMRKSSTVDAATWYCSMVIVALVLLSFFTGSSWYDSGDVAAFRESSSGSCDEIYVVQEGETLNTISDKCGDPYIVEQNPHISDPDDVYPGLVIKITSVSKTSRKLLR